jgi:hypothetical protein
MAIFEDERQICSFLNCIDEFSDHVIDEVQEGEEPPLIQLKSNKIPRGLVPLERLFDRSDAFIGSKQPCADQQVVEVDIGSRETPRIIKIGKGCTEEERKKITTLVREYQDVFAWTYDELKTYDPKIISHAIPLKEDAKPFRQRQRYMNPKVAPHDTTRVAKLYEAKNYRTNQILELGCKCCPSKKEDR